MIWSVPDDPAQDLVATEQLVALHAELVNAVGAGSTDEEHLRGAISTGFLLNALPPELALGFEERLALLDVARAAATTLGLDETVVNALHRQSRLLLAAGDIGEARARLEQAEPRLAKAPAMRPWVLLDLGSCARLAGEWKAALAFIDRARAALDPAAYPAHELADTSILGELFEIHLGWGTVDQARVWLDRERESAARTARPEALFAAAIHTIDWCLASEDWSGAVREVDDALESPELLAASPDARAKLLLRRALAWNQAGRAHAGLTARIFDAALEEPALSGADRLVALGFLAYLELGRGQLDAAEENLARARSALAELDRRAAPLIDTAYQQAFFDTIDSRLALERGAPRSELERHLESVRASFEELLSTWRQTPLVTGGIGFLSHGRRRLVLSQLFRLERAVFGEEEGVARALEALMRTHALGTLAREHDADAASLEALRNELMGPNEALLVYFPAPDVSHVFAVDASSLLHVELAASVDLRDAQGALVRALLSRPDHEPGGNVDPRSARRWSGAAKRLAEVALPDEVREFLLEAKDGTPRTSVTVVGADLRSWFPLECLPIDESRTVGEALAVAHLPSLPFALELARRPRSGPVDCDLRVLASPTHSSDVRSRYRALEPLPRDPTLLAGVTAPYGRVERFVGEHATESALRRSPARVLQLLCHGVYDTSRVRPAGLVLAPSDDAGLFFCEDAEAAPVADVVVLAACGAGRGPLRRGDEDVNHLGGAFLRGGSNTVLQSQADLDLTATLTFLETFHGALATPGTSTAEAARIARVKLAADPSTDHPYYHSLLQVVGLGHRAVFGD